MMKLLNKKRASSVLGLAFDGNRLEGVVVRRSANGLQVRQSLSVPLALSPLGGDPVLVGREIRNHLDQAGIRERRCVLCLPVGWTLSLQTRLPELEDADLESFLQLEAERGFTSGHENLYITKSISKTVSGDKYATQVAVPRNHLETLEKALRAAQLKPLSFSLGMAALENAGKAAASGMLTLALGSNSLELGASIGDNIVTLRSLDGAVESVGAQKHVDAELVAREIRITLGQMPAELADGIRTVRVFARGDLARLFVNDISPRLQSMGLRVEVMDRASGAEFSSSLTGDVALSPALALAANFVQGVASGPELLPPKVHPFQVWMAKRAVTRKMGWAGLAAAGAAAAVLLLFGYQIVTLTTWENKLASISDRAKGAKDAQGEMNKYQTWYDQNYQALSILKVLADAFPQQSTVVAKTVQVRGLSEVTCSGTSRDALAYRKVIENLGTNKETVRDVTTESYRNNTFTLKFTWMGGDNGS